VNFRPGSNPSHKDRNPMTPADRVHSTPPLSTSLADELHREVEHAPPDLYIVKVRRELMARIEAALRGPATAAAEAKPGKTQRQWTAITSERTRLAREDMADQISRIQDEELREKLRQQMCVLFLFLEEDLESAAAQFGGPL
jgi:hypothetical protein